MNPVICLSIVPVVSNFLDTLFFTIEMPGIPVFLKTGTEIALIIYEKPMRRKEERNEQNISCHSWLFCKRHQKQY